MTCEYERDKDGNVVMIKCGSSWGMGVTTLHGVEAREFGGSMYGFAMGGNPHDFEPDREVCSAAEIKAWEDAKVAWDLMEGKGQSETFPR